MRRQKFHEYADLYDIIAGIPFKLDYYRFMIGYTRYLEAKMVKSGMSKKQIEEELTWMLEGSVIVFNKSHARFDPAMGDNLATVKELTTFLHHAYVYNEQYVIEQQETL